MSVSSARAALIAPPGRVGEHARQTLRLALPVMLSRAGVLALVIVDSIMTGRFGAEQLAFYALGIGPQILFLLVGLGGLLGTVVLTAQAVGAGREADCGAVWRTALLHAAGYGLVLALLCASGERILLLFGQSPELAAGGGRVMAVLGWSLPGMLLFVATTLFLEAIGRPLAGMIVMLLANLLNIALNGLLIYGVQATLLWGSELTIPALGAEGAALATTVVRWFMFFAIAGYVWLGVDRRRFGITAPIADPWGLGRRLRRIGYPMALTQGMESSAFTTMTLFAGWQGVLTAAAFQITLSLIALVFMFALGFSTAASVRVGNAVGRGDPAGQRRAGWVAAALAVVVLSLWALLFAAAPAWLAGFYTRDDELQAAAAAAVLLAALVLIPDGLQAVLMGALRGLADVWPATLLFLVAFWLVMVPLGYWLGVVRDGGAAGLVQAILAGCVTAAVLLGWRFQRVSKRPIRRV